MTNIIHLLFLITSTEVSGKIIFLKDVSVLNLLRKFTMLISKKQPTQTQFRQSQTVIGTNMNRIIMFTIILHNLQWSLIQNPISAVHIITVNTASIILFRRQTVTVRQKPLLTSSDTVCSVSVMNTAPDICLRIRNLNRLIFLRLRTLKR